MTDITNPHIPHEHNDNPALTASHRGSHEGGSDISTLEQPYGSSRDLFDEFVDMGVYDGDHGDTPGDCNGNVTSPDQSSEASSMIVRRQGRSVEEEIEGFAPVTKLPRKEKGSNFGIKTDIWAAGPQVSEKRLRWHHLNHEVLDEMDLEPSTESERPATLIHPTTPVNGDIQSTADGDVFKYIDTIDERMCKPSPLVMSRDDVVRPVSPVRLGDPWDPNEDFQYSPPQSTTSNPMRDAVSSARSPLHASTSSSYGRPGSDAELSGYVVGALTSSRLPDPHAPVRSLSAASSDGNALSKLSFVSEGDTRPTHPSALAHDGRSSVDPPGDSELGSDVEDFPKPLKGVELDAAHEAYCREVKTYSSLPETNKIQRRLARELGTKDKHPWDDLQYGSRRGRGQIATSIDG
jgi:hypothetical protein